MKVSLEYNLSAYRILKSDIQDAIIHTRIINDERPLKRVIKKFHNYAALVHTPIVPATPGSSNITVEDAREAFLIEVASFELMLKKCMMICEAEERQVEEYERERTRIGKFHTSLEHSLQTHSRFGYIQRMNMEN